MREETKKQIEAARGKVAAKPTPDEISKLEAIFKKHKYEVDFEWAADPRVQAPRGGEPQFMGVQIPAVESTSGADGPKFVIRSSSWGGGAKISMKYAANLKSALNLLKEISRVNSSFVG